MNVSHPFGKLILLHLQQFLKENGDGCKSIVILLKQMYREAFKYYDQGLTIGQIYSNFEIPIRICLNEMENQKVQVEEFGNFTKLKQNPVYFVFKNGIKKVTILDGFVFQLSSRLAMQTFDVCNVIFLDLNSGETKTDMKFSTASERRNIHLKNHQNLKSQLDIIQKSKVGLIFTLNDLPEFLQYHLDSKIVRVSKTIFDVLLQVTKGHVSFEVNDSLGPTRVSNLQIMTDEGSSLLFVPSEGCQSVIIQEENRIQMNSLKKSVLNNMSDTFYLFGGGSIEMTLSNFLRKRKDPICDVFASILESIPLILVRNSSSKNEFSTVTEWRDRSKSVPLAFNQVLMDPKEHVIYDSFHVKCSILTKTLELFKLLFNIDGIIKMENQEKQPGEYAFDLSEMENVKRKYNRFTPSIEKGISKEQKERMKRKEEFFYDK
jgi:chaperonin GroEL (HSP60 family)